MKATLGQRPAAGIVGNLENELLLLLFEVAKFKGEEYWQRAVGGKWSLQLFMVYLFCGTTVF